MDNLDGMNQSNPVNSKHAIQYRERGTCLRPSFITIEQIFRSIAHNLYSSTGTPGPSSDNSPNNSRDYYGFADPPVSKDHTHKVKTGRITKKNIHKKVWNEKVPEVIQQNQSLLRYWKKRFTLFSKFDEGIQLDKESWYSVTPEDVARELADRIKCDVIVDAFCGCGGNTIQFAKSGKRVIAIDIDGGKIEKAKHNAKIYKVDDKIEFIVGDFLKVFKDLKGVDAIFLSPPWGGMNYKYSSMYNIETQLQPIGASPLLKICRQITENIAVFLPRNSDTKQIRKLAGLGKYVEIEHNYSDCSLVGMTAFFGNLVNRFY